MMIQTTGIEILIGTIRGDNLQTYITIILVTLSNVAFLILGNFLSKKDRAIQNTIEQIKPLKTFNLSPKKEDIKKPDLEDIKKNEFYD